MAIVKKDVHTKWYTAIKAVGPNDKCPPQAALIMKTIEEAGGKISRPDILALLSRTPEEGGLTTRQTPDRILGFYVPKLKDMGVLSDEIITTQVDVEVPDEPVKETAQEAVAEAPAAEAASEAPAPGHKEKGRRGTPKSETQAA